MKILTLIFTLLFLIVISSSKSFAKWTKVSTSVDGDYYVDLERIRKHKGYRYVWELIDFKQPNKLGVVSGKVYLKIDCNIFRFQNLQYSFHKQPMGLGTGDIQDPVEKSKGWKYPNPGSAIEQVINAVCNY